MIFDRYASGERHLRIMSIGGVSGVFDLKSESWRLPIVYEKLVALGKDHYIAKKDGKVGVIDSLNNIIFDFQWLSMRKVASKGNFCIVLHALTKKYGVIDILQQKLLIPCEYDLIEDDGNERLHVIKNNRHNIINLQGKYLFSFWYDQLERICINSLNYIAKRDNLTGIIDSNEEQIIPFEYLSIVNVGKRCDILLACNKSGKFGFISDHGELILATQYDYIGPNWSSAATTILESNLYGLFKLKDGNPEFLLPCEFQIIIYTQGGFITRKNNKYGLANHEGTVVLENLYDSILPLANNLFVLEFNGKSKLIDNNGNPVSAEYRNLVAVYDKYLFNGTYAASMKFNYLKFSNSEGKYGLISKMGAEVLEPSFDAIQSIIDDQAIVLYDGKFGVFDLIGKDYLFRPEFEEILSTADGLIGVKGNEFYRLLTDRKEPSRIRL